MYISLHYRLAYRLCLPQQNKSYLSAFPTPPAPAVPLCYPAKRGKKPSAWDNSKGFLCSSTPTSLTFCDKTCTIIIAKWLLCVGQLSLSEVVWRTFLFNFQRTNLNILLNCLVYSLLKLISLFRSSLAKLFYSQLTIFILYSLVTILSRVFCKKKKFF